MRCIRNAKERELAPQPPESPPAAGASEPQATLQRQQQQHSAHIGPADKALKHLLLYVDADELYKTALGMYDLSLSYMVIANAQVCGEGVS